MLAVRQSFDRAKQANFAQHFYSLFLASDPAVRRKFERTDFEQQRGLLIHGVYSMLDFAEGKPLGKLALERLAIRHGPAHLDIPAPMYDRWLACFLEALRRTDPEFDEALAAAWRDALRPGIARLASHESGARPRRGKTIPG